MVNKRIGAGKKRELARNKPKAKYKGFNSYGKYRESFDKRTKLMDLLRPYEISQYKLHSEHNPSQIAVPMGFGRSVTDELHVVPYYVPFNKTEVFKYRGHLYDASMMTTKDRNKILKLME